MKVYDVAQGTSQWLYLRAGIPTASNFDQIVTKSGAESKSREKYMLKLLAERVMGHPVEEYVSFWMKRGSEMEGRALKAYQFQRDEENIVRVGFVTNDAGDRGASPDAFVGDNGTLEIKCPSESEHMSYLLQSGSHYDTYKVQVQGQLLICEKDFTDVLSYHPELPEALARIGRDETFIRKLDSALDQFCEDLAAMFQQLVRMGIVDEVAEKRKPKADPEQPAPSITDVMRETLIAFQKS